MFVAVNPYHPIHIRPLARTFSNVVAELRAAGMNGRAVFAIQKATRRAFPHLAWDKATRIVLVTGHDRETLTIPDPKFTLETTHARP